MKKKTSLLLSALLIAPFLLWTGAAGAMFFWIKYQKNFTQISYTDIAFPWNWAQVKPKWGGYYIDKGITFKEEQDWDQAFFYLRVGLRKAPKHLDGRLALADLLFKAGQIPRAIDLLKGGIPYAQGHHQFWSDAMRYLQFYQVDREIIDIFSQALDKELIPEDMRTQATYALAQAHFHQADFNTTEAICSKQKDQAFKLLKLKCLWERGMQNVALSSLETFMLLYPDNRTGTSLLTEWYSESGDTDTAINLARSAYYQKPGSYDFAEIWWRQIPDEDTIQKALHNFNQQYPGTLLSDQNGVRLFNLLAECGWPDTFDYWQKQMTPAQQKAPLLAFLRLECLIRAQDWPRARNEFDTLKDRANLNIPLFKTLYHSFGLLISGHEGESETAERHYQALVSLPHIRPETLLRISNQLRTAHLPELAHKIVRFLLVQNPGNHLALVERIQIELDLDRFQDAFGPLMALHNKNQLPNALKEQTLTYLASDQHRFEPHREELLSLLLQSMPPTKRQTWLKTFEL